MARGFVLATVLAGIVAIAIASGVISHGSGTYFATLIAMPLLVVPGGLVWWQPRARWFVVWSVTSFITSASYLLFGDPYAHERELPGWQATETAIWIAISLVVVGALFGAFYLGAHPRTDDELAAPLARRLRRIVHLVVAIAILIAVVALLPGERVYAGDTFLYVRSAGGPLLTVALALLLVPGVLVYRDPRKRWAWLWFAWALPASLFVLILVVGFHLLAHGEDLWPLVVARFGALTMIVLLLVGLPLIALGTRERPELPEARLRS